MAQNLLQLLLQPTGKPFGGLQNFLQGIRSSNTGVPFGGFLGLSNLPDTTRSNPYGGIKYDRHSEYGSQLNGWEPRLPGSSGTPEIDALNFIKDRRIRGIAREQGRSVENREDVNTATNTSALQFLADSRARLEDLFGNRTSEIERLISSAPYTNELLESRKQQGYNQIQSELDPLLQQTQVNFASRGLGRSSMAQNAGGALRGSAISGRANLLNDLINQQFQTNTEAERIKQSMLGQLETSRAGMETNLSSLESQIKAGNVIDPGVLAAIMGDALSADIGIENMEKYFDLMNRMSNQQNNPINLGIDAVGNFANMGFPGAPLFGAGVNLFGDMLKSLLGFGNFQLK